MITNKATTTVARQQGLLCSASSIFFFEFCPAWELVCFHRRKLLSVARRAMIFFMVIIPIAKTKKQLRGEKDKSTSRAR